MVVKSGSMVTKSKDDPGIRKHQPGQWVVDGVSSEESRNDSSPVAWCLLHHGCALFPKSKLLAQKSYLMFSK